METGSAIALGAGALVLVLLINRQREAQTNAVIAAQLSQVHKPGSALSTTDQINILGSIGSFYLGGVGAGTDFVKGIK